MRYPLGRQMSCLHCGSDIEYHGPGFGWSDRGGNHRCATSGACFIDGNGVFVRPWPPSLRHSPYYPGRKPSRFRKPGFRRPR